MTGQRDEALPVTLFQAILSGERPSPFAGAFPKPEDELAGFTAAGWQGAGRSPDRADAMIWAMTELAVSLARAAPSLRRL